MTKAEVEALIARLNASHKSLRANSVSDKDYGSLYTQAAAALVAQAQRIKELTGDSRHLMADGRAEKAEARAEVMAKLLREAKPIIPNPDKTDAHYRELLAQRIDAALAKEQK